MSGPAWVGWVVAAVAVLVAVIAEALRRIEARRWEADTTRLQTDVLQWWDEAQKRRRTIEELQARCKMLLGELDKAQSRGRCDEERYNCGDREVASGDIVGMCSVCHQRSYARALEPVEWATRRAEMCACPCHALNGAEGTP